jgi:hypothetical protein
MASDDQKFGGLMEDEYKKVLEEMKGQGDLD